MEKKQIYVSQECYWKIFTWCHNIFEQQLPNGTAAGISMKEPLRENLLKKLILKRSHVNVSSILQLLI